VHRGRRQVRCAPKRVKMRDLKVRLHRENTKGTRPNEDPESPYAKSRFRAPHLSTVLPERARELLQFAGSALKINHRHWQLNPDTTNVLA
jgi:hypothetical protein